MGDMQASVDRAHAALDRAGVPDGTLSARIGVLWGDREELLAARQWIEENWNGGDDEDAPENLLEAITRIRDWGDAAWGAAGHADERRHELEQQLRLAGGLLEFEGNVFGALQVISNALGGREPLIRMVAVDPGFAGWTPDCSRCGQPIGDWDNCWMHPDEPDDPDGVMFAHRRCPS